MDNAVLNLQVNILFFINSLKASGMYQPWTERVFEFNTNTTLGTLNINNPTGTTEILDYDMSSIVKVTQDEYGNFNACVNNLPLKYFNVDMDYTADIGINEEIPIFGSGNIKIDINDIELSMCWILNPEQNYINDIDIDIAFRHGPVFLGGVFNNPLLDPPISNVLTAAYRFFAMWASYEPECSKWVLNSLVKFLANYVIYRIEDDSLDMDCSCVTKISELKNFLSIAEDVIEDPMTHSLAGVILEYIS